MMIGLDNPLHIALLLLVLLLLFGAKRLPEMGRSLGHGLRGFKESLSGEVHEPVAGLRSDSAEAPARPAVSSSGAPAEATPAPGSFTADSTRA